MGIKSTRSRSLGKLLNAWRSIDVTGNGPIINSAFKTDRFQPAAMNASGGTKVVVGADTWHIFYGGPEDGPNIFTVTEGPTGPGGTCEILVLGGGGGGGYFYGDAGGAGGAFHHPTYPITNDNPYTCALGEGGESECAPGGGGTRGEDTDFYPTPAGGGFGTSGQIRAWGGAGGNANGAPAGSDPSSPIHSGCLGGIHYPSALNPTFPTQAFPPGGTAYAYRGGHVAETPGQDARGGGGLGGNTPDEASKIGAAGRAFPSFPGPGMWPGIPSPVQAELTTTWRDTLGPTGLMGGGGNAWIPGTGPFSPTDRPAGGGGGWPSDPTGGSPIGAGVNYTGSGGGGPYAGNNPTDCGSDGGHSIVMIKYATGPQ